jgi:hypothetical protein
MPREHTLLPSKLATDELGNESLSSIGNAFSTKAQADGHYDDLIFYSISHSHSFSVSLSVLPLMPVSVPSSQASA